MEVTEHLDRLGEYISYVNLKILDHTKKHDAGLHKLMTRLQGYEIFKLMDEKHQLAVDVHMFAAKLHPQRPRRNRTGRVTRTKIHHEHKRKEELLILRHRIRKKIARLSNEIILYLYHKNPDEILPRSQLSW